jgi:hypothetical protein
LKVGKTCDRCGAPIRFLRTTGGKWTPVDRAPSDEAGTIRMLAGGRAEKVTPQTAESLRADGHLLFISHFETCTKPPRGRRRDDGGEYSAAQARRRAARAPFRRLLGPS